MVVKMVNKCMTFIFISNYRREAQSPCSCQSNRNIETQVTPAKSMYAMRPRQSNRTKPTKLITFYSNQFPVREVVNNAKTTILCFVTTWGQFSQSLARYEENRNLGKFCLKKQYAELPSLIQYFINSTMRTASRSCSKRDLRQFAIRLVRPILTRWTPRWTRKDKDGHRLQTHTTQFLVLIRET